MFGDMDHKSFEHPQTSPGGLARSRPKTAVSSDMKPAGVTNWPYASQSVTKSNVACLATPKISSVEMGGHDEILNKFKTTILGRGARGVIGLRRSFSIVDDDGSKSLNWEEFTKALHDFRVKCTEAEA